MNMSLIVKPIPNRECREYAMLGADFLSISIPPQEAAQ